MAERLHEAQLHLVLANVCSLIAGIESKGESDASQSSAIFHACAEAAHVLNSRCEADKLCNAIPGKLVTGQMLRSKQLGVMLAPLYQALYEHEIYRKFVLLAHTPPLPPA